MLETFHLEQLDAFARVGTVSGAARELCITQPALSRNLKKIEQIIGVSLFERRNGRLLLNENGKIAAQQARYALDSIAQVVEATRAHDLSRTSLFVGSSNIPPMRRIAPLIADLFTDKTVTTMLATNQELLSGLRHYKLDLAVFYGKPMASDIYTTDFMKERLCISVPGDHLLAHRSEVTFSDLEGMSIIAVSNAGLWMDVCLRHLPRENLVVLSNMVALGELVQSSSLPSFCSDLVDPINGGLQGRVIIPISDDDALTVYHLGCLESEKERFRKLFDAVCSGFTF